jgi:hypothetical protein
LRDSLHIVYIESRGREYCGGYIIHSSSGVRSSYERGVSVCSAEGYEKIIKKVIGSLGTGQVYHIFITSRYDVQISKFEYTRSYQT